jgi:hypothetical protein
MNPSGRLARVVGIASILTAVVVVYDFLAKPKDDLSVEFTSIQFDEPATQVRQRDAIRGVGAERYLETKLRKAGVTLAPPQLSAAASAVDELLAGLPGTLSDPRWHPTRSVWRAVVRNRGVTHLEDVQLVFDSRDMPRHVEVGGKPVNPLAPVQLGKMAPFATTEVQGWGDFHLQYYEFDKVRLLHSRGVGEVLRGTSAERMGMTIERYLPLSYLLIPAMLAGVATAFYLRKGNPRQSKLLQLTPLAKLQLKGREASDEAAIPTNADEALAAAGAPLPDQHERGAS